MPKPQLHRRLPGPFVGEVLEAFNAHRMSETQACTLLGIKRRCKIPSAAGKGAPDTFIPGKGKIEKRFDYFQRRLPQLCQRYSITNIAHAAPLLDDLVAYYNERCRHAETGEIPQDRWERALRRGQSRLRSVPAGVDLTLVFAIQVSRRVKSDRTISFAAQRWPVGAPPARSSRSASGLMNGLSSFMGDSVWGSTISECPLSWSHNVYF